MGQINSTDSARRAISASRNSPGSSTVDTGVQARTDVERFAPPTDTDNFSRKRGHRRSLRSGLVNPSISSGMGGLGQATSRADEENKKWWRRSRRWSKTPVIRCSDSHGVADDTVPQAVQELGTDMSPPERGVNDTMNGDNSVPLLSVGGASNEFVADPVHLVRDKELPPGVEPASTLSKGKEVASAAPDAATASPEGNLKEHSDSARTGPLGASDRTQPPVTLGRPPESSESELATASGNNALNSEGSSLTSTQAEDNHPLHQFPLAGTLVVVQGVVHTSDAARPTHSGVASTAQTASPRFSPESTTGAQQHLRSSVGSQRNSVLANLLRRRNSTTSLGSRASMEPGAVEIPGSREEVSRAEPEDLAPISSQSRSTETTPPTTSDADARRNPHRQGQLSSNSVDVLGALLSVATAATAASLLSSLNGQRTSPRPSRVSGDSRPEPTGLPLSDSSSASAIPALARALATANPAAAAAIAQREREREREESERNRVRTLWDGLRERLVHGRGGSTYTPGRQFPLPENSQVPAGRERRADGSVIPDSLFSELARAFNLGPSQEQPASAASSESANANQDGPTQSQGTQDRRELDDTPPDSFERFLIDLQTDLRVALTHMDTTPYNAANRPSRDNGLSEDVGDSAESRHVARMNLGDNSTGLDVASESATAPFGAGVESVGSGRHADEDDSESETINTSHPEAPSSENSGEHNIESDEERQSLSHGNAASFTRPSSSDDASAMRGDHISTVNERGINWWRMYQFPPMRFPQSRQRNATTATPSNIAVIPIDSSMNAQSSDSSAMGTAASSHAVSNSPSQEYAVNLVVPVIVVGLQSIASGTRRPQPQASNPTYRTEGDANGAAGEERDPDVASTYNSIEFQRGRNWPSRAARAMSRLGWRSGTSATGQDQDAREAFGSGARTFFIYVFGGYYPPDHRILTGTDGLDSFEALWDLAEMLGQVKPPVATEEEIEQSGLEVFKAKSLEEFERNGRVASNCVDRCLICLDDYESEDDLRLLSCKHAFHKVCVDQWLKTGRNNCPTCRSKGVGIGEENGPAT